IPCITQPSVGKH
ncbi:hypothetical protein CP061683_0799B, partial [Chlamydia psittaci 06-1683]